MAQPYRCPVCNGTGQVYPGVMWDNQPSLMPAPFPSGLPKYEFPMNGDAFYSLAHSADTSSQNGLDRCGSDNS